MIAARMVAAVPRQAPVPRLGLQATPEAAEAVGASLGTNCLLQKFSF